jgi:sigma54-dependent transcription regulator
MATLVENGRIDESNVKNEIVRLKERWYQPNDNSKSYSLESILDSEPTCKC